MSFAAVYYSVLEVKLEVHCTLLLKIYNKSIVHLYNTVKCQ